MQPGIGKTAVTIRIAQRFDGEIINADSMQIYRQMDIGTAKPTPEEQAVEYTPMIHLELNLGCIITQVQSKHRPLVESLAVITEADGGVK